MREMFYLRGPCPPIVGTLQAGWARGLQMIDVVKTAKYTKEEVLKITMERTDHEYLQRMV